MEAAATAALASCGVTAAEVEYVELSADGPGDIDDEEIKGVASVFTKRQGAAVAPASVAAPATSSGVSADKATETVLAVLAAKTGYEPEMIEMDMALETELGVDSIKRVEILSEVQKQLSVEAQDVAALSRTQTCLLYTSPSPRDRG